MNIHRPDRVHDSLHWYPYAACVFVTLTGAVVMAGWFLDIPILRTALPGFHSMKFNTALCFFGLGVSLGVLHHSTEQKIRRFVQGLAGLVVLVAALTVGEYLFQWNLGIDELFIRDLGIPPAPFPGRMSGITALCFVLSGLSLLSFEQPRVSQPLALSAGGFAFLALIGYLYDFQALYNLLGYSSIALHTALSFFLLSLATLAAQPTTGVMEIVLSRRSGSRNLRKALPAMIFITILIGWLIHTWIRLKRLEVANGIDILVVLLILIFSPLIYYNARGWNQVEADLIKSEEKFSGMFYSSLLAKALLTRDGTIVDINQAFCEIVEHSPAKMIGKKVADCMFLTDQEQVWLAETLVDASDTIHTLEVHFPHPRERWQDILLSLSKISLQEDGYVLMDGTDITQMVQVERQLRQMKRMYAVLSQINQTIVRVQDRQELFQAICDVSVQFGEFSLAWIGLLDNRTGDIQPVAANGMNVHHWPFPIANILRGDLKDGLISNAIRQSKVMTSEDVQAELKLKTLYGLFKKFSYHSAAAIPFQLRGITIGMMSLLSPETGLFKDVEEIKLLEEIALDISFALDTMQTELERNQAEVDLRESEARYRLLLENSLDAVILSTLDGRIFGANRAACEMFGYTELEIIQGGRELIVDPSDPRLAEALTEGERTGSFKGELTLVRKNGEKFSGELSSVVYTNHHGEKRTSIIIRDVTERSRLESALKKSFLEYRTLVETSNDGIIHNDIDGNIIFVNNRFAKLFGYESAEEILNSGITTFELLAPRERDTAMERAAPVFDDDHIRNVEMKVLRKDGVQFDAEFSTTLLRNDQGNPKSLITFVSDVSERKQAEEQLRASEELFRTVVENSHEGINLLDLKTGRYTFMSPRQVELTGFSPEEMNNFSDEEALARVHPDDLEISESQKRMVAAGEIPPGTTEYRWKVKSGEYRWFSDTRSLVHDAQGEPIALVGVSQDITEKKQVEEELHSRTQLLQTIGENFPHAYITVINKDLTAGFSTGQEFKLQNLDPNSFLGLHIDDVYGVFGPEILDTIKEKYLATFAGEQHSFELFLNEQFQRYDTVPLEDRDGNISQILVVVQNVTERKRAEHALLQSKAHLEEAQRIAHLGSWDWIAATDTPTWSRELCLILEVDPDKPVPSMAEQDKLYTPDSMVRMRTSVAKTLETGEPYEIELERVREDGSRRWLLARGERWYDEAGQLIGLRGTALDITERKLAEIRITQQVARLEGLHQIDMAITSGFGSKVSLEVILDRVVSLLSVDAAVIHLMDRTNQLLRYAAGRGFDSAAIEQSEFVPGQGLAGRAVSEQKFVYIPNLTQTSNEMARIRGLAEENFIAYYAIPLITKGMVEGVLEIFHRSPLHPDEDWFYFAETLAHQTAIAVENDQLVNRLLRKNDELLGAYDETIEGWSRALDLRDNDTEGHTLRTTELTLQLARAIGVKEEELIHIRRGALLHDIGKLGVPDRILLKPGPLTDEEWVIMRQHPQFAYDMLSSIEYLRPALEIPYCHHERWDGTGYPRGLKDAQIPLSARLFSVVDVWDALRSDRPYRPAWPDDKVRDYILSLKGTYFSPMIVDLFFEMLDEKGSTWIEDK